MQRHDFDGLSFALGLVTILAGVLAAAGRLVGRFDASSPFVPLAIGLLALAIAVTALRPRRATTGGAEDADS